METMEINSDSSSSNSGSDTEEHEFTQKAEELESQLLANKYLYDVHLELVEIYYKLGDLTSMRAAYERFHECFPLTSAIWLKWIKEEIKLATTPTDQKKVLKLFEEAVQDYLCVNLWMEYIQYSFEVSNAASTREIIEKSLQAAGLHAAKGALLWDTLRELEMANITHVQSSDDEYRQKVHNLNEIYRRQLSVPLVGMENTYREWQEWLDTMPPDLVDRKPVEYGYKNAMKLLEKYSEFEERLLVTNDEQELYNIYAGYLDVLKDPSSVLCVYERAVAQLCLNTGLWCRYCLYAMKLGEVAGNVSSRALRNCPWSEDLWIARLRILENQGKGEEELLSSFEQGVSSIAPAPGVELWLAYLEYNIRKSSDDKLNKLFEQAGKQVGYEGDPTCKVNRLYARMVAKKGDVKTARKLWDGVLHQPQNKENTYMWLEYANLERQHGDASHLRQIYQRGINVCNWPAFLAEQWLFYERENGTLQDVLKCMDKCSKVQSQTVPISRSNTTNVETTSRTPKRKRDEKTTEERVPARKKVIPSAKPFTKDPKTTVFVSNLASNVNEANLKEMFPNATHVEMVHDRKGNFKCYGFVQFEMEEEVLTALARDREPLNGRPVFISNLKESTSNNDTRKFQYSNDVEENKLFVRGLPQSYSQEQVEAIFKEYGAKAVRIVMFKSGKSKGLAYVEFENGAAAKKAQTQTDKRVIDGHEIIVAISAPPRHNKEQPSEPANAPRSRLQVAMVPRTVQLKSVAKESNGSAGPAKSNADFRSLFLSK